MVAQYLARATLKGLSEKKNLELIIDGEHTSPGDTTENVGASTLEERHDTLGLDDLAGSVEGALILDSLTRGHHHTAADGIKRVGGDTSASGDAPTEKERGEEVVFKIACENYRLNRVVHTEVKTTVDNDTGDRRHEATVKTGDTVRGNGLPVYIDEAIELALTALLGRLGIIGKTGTGVIERVDKEKRSGTSSLSSPIHPVSEKYNSNIKYVHGGTYIKGNLMLTPPEARLPAIHFQ